MTVLVTDKMVHAAFDWLDDHAGPAAAGETRSMTGLWARLSPEQRKRALEYDGPEISGGTHLPAAKRATPTEQPTSPAEPEGRGVEDSPATEGKPYVIRAEPDSFRDGGKVVVPFKTNDQMDAILVRLASRPSVDAGTVERIMNDLIDAGMYLPSCDRDRIGYWQEKILAAHKWIKNASALSPTNERRKALEEAAQVADRFRPIWGDGARMIGLAIRALASEQEAG